MGLLPSGKVRRGGREGHMDRRESDKPRGMGGREEKNRHALILGIYNMKLSREAIIFIAKLTELGHVLLFCTVYDGKMDAGDTRFALMAQQILFFSQTTQESCMSFH